MEREHFSLSRWPLDVSVVNKTVLSGLKEVPDAKRVNL